MTGRNDALCRREFDPEELCAVRALPAIDIHAHYGCWNVPAEKQTAGRSETMGALSYLLRNSAYANIAVSCVSHFGTLFPIGHESLLWNETAIAELSGTQRVKLLITLDPRRSESFSQAERLLQNQVCMGLKIHPAFHHYSICEYGEAIYAFAERLGVPIIAHTGESGCMPEEFVPFADCHPEVVTVLSHLGCGPDDGELHQCCAIEHSHAGNLYTDTSSARSMDVELIEWAVRRIGAERILFGTDSGCYFSPSQRARIDCALLSRGDKKKILFENALRVFPQLREDYRTGCARLCALGAEAR